MKGFFLFKVCGLKLNCICLPSEVRMAFLVVNVEFPSGPMVNFQLQKIYMHSKIDDS